MKRQTLTKSDHAEPQSAACCGKAPSTDQSAVHQFRQLHQTIGNRGVGRLIQTKLQAPQIQATRQQNETGDTQIDRQDEGGMTRVYIFGGVPHFLDCSKRALDSDPDTTCCSSHTQSLIPGLYTRSRDFTDRAIQRVAAGANMDGAITRHFGSGALSERSEILSRLRIIRAELDKESAHKIRCRIALNATNAIGYELLPRVDSRLFCQSNVQASARVGGTVATLCVDVNGNPAGGWSTLLHEMVHLSGVGNLPDRSAATPTQTAAREYETYEHQRGAGLYPNPMPFSLRNADSFSSFVAEIGAESWSAETNLGAFLPTLEAGGIMSLGSTPRFGLGGGMLWTPFGSNIQPLIGARALWLPTRGSDVPPAVQPTDLRAYAGGELGLRWITGGPRVQFVLDVAGGAGAYVTVDENVDPALMARLGLGLRFGGPQLGFGISADFMRLFHLNQSGLVGTGADDWFGGLGIRGHWAGSSTRPR